jgi:oligopeptide/dipeptide ABC transporter ATP-binding protein
MTGALLHVRNLRKSFPARRGLFGSAGRAVVAADNVSFQMNAGETLALIGESGCGKSTTGRLILRLIEPDAGQVLFEGEDLNSLDAAGLRAFRAKAQLIFQDPYASFNPSMTMGAALAEPLRLHTKLGKAERAARINRLLRLTGLNEGFAARYPHQLSGGQRQRIAIARAIAAGPKLIVCDEPVSALDVSIRAQILNLLKDLQREYGLALLFISHDIGAVAHIADRIAIMYLGRIVETGTADQIFNEPRHPYTHALFSAIPRLGPVTAGRSKKLMPGDPPSPLAPPPGCHLHPRCSHAVAVCPSAVPPLTADANGHATACHIWETIEAGDVISAAAPVPVHLEKLIAAYEPRNA